MWEGEREGGREGEGVIGGPQRPDVDLGGQIWTSEAPRGEGGNKSVLNLPRRSVRPSVHIVVPRG